MAKALIDSLTSEFDAEQYKDEYREELLALIERKAEGREHRQLRDRGAEADQGARPDGGARGEPRRGQGRGVELEEASAKQAAPAKKTSKADREARQRQASRGRGPRALAHQPRQGPVAGAPGGRGGSKPAFTKGEVIDYYARVGRDDPPPPARPAADPGPLPRRGRGQALLREAGAQPHARLGPHRADRDGPRSGCSTSSSATTCRP